MKLNNFDNKKILITGATGSIGSAVIFELIKYYKFKVIRALSNDENGLFELGQKINPESSNFNSMMRSNKIRLIHGDIRNYERCLEVSRGIDIIIHAAAMKHVPICEYNPSEALSTNILGTENICKAASMNKVKKVIFISTDKAVNPQTLMGTTKLMGEKIILNANDVSSNNKVIFSCIRFGNVIGSRGSVLEIFKKQIEKNQRITLTDQNMTRFFIDVGLAARQILNALKISRGGEIFIIKAMRIIKIFDLAKVLINFYKKKIKFKFIGIRRNEKLFEEILTQKESDNAIENKNFIIINQNYNSTANLKYYSAHKLVANNLFANSKKGSFMKETEIKHFLIKNRLI